MSLADLIDRINRGLPARPEPNDANVTPHESADIDSESGERLPQLPRYPEKGSRRKAFIHADVTPVTPVTPIKNKSEHQSYEFPMSEGEESLIRQWLAQIGEHDPQTLADVVHTCQIDLLSRDYHLRQAWDQVTDDSIHCADCSHLQDDGQCTGVPIGVMPRGGRYWKPDQTIKRRCKYFLTKPPADTNVATATHTKQPRHTPT